MKLKKVSSMILAVTLACTMTVTPVLADEVSDLKQKKQETQNQVSDLQTQLNSLMTKISDLENDLIETGEEISQTEEDLKTAQEEQEQQYAAMKLRIKYMYERRNRNCHSGEGSDIRRYFQCTDTGRIFPAGTFL